MYCLDIQHLCLQFDHKPLFADLHFCVEQGEWAVLLGRSGVGKSTLLRAIAGLEEATITEGHIQLASHTKAAWLAQQDSLFPWLSVLDNVQLAQHLQGQKNAKTQEKAKELLHAVGMADHWHKPCYQLSGGQRQRVALARTLMQDADLILMDEPFSALDAVTRLQLQNLACELLQGKTVILVTHDPQEAIRLGEKIYVLQGQPVQIKQVAQLDPIKPHQLHQEALWALQNRLIEQLMAEPT
ncbi:ABC transporter ATP-binding protein [Aggregatibacter segnis]|uniref:ABC transporter ATP-binding protein n=1 Tax=Aggregatibacter segnis TaxID=739 RepID=A0A8B2U785_9PAST|nr:ABC transporter ATP-binding protein [Aggregatibacter segnis]RDE71796.1 ABC transporter ATP-binding protein [Aggregatibacter segnis]